MRYLKPSQIKELDTAVNTPEFLALQKRSDALDKAIAGKIAGLGLVTMGAPLAGFALHYRLTSTGQTDLKTAFEHYSFPQKRADINVRHDGNPMAPMVNAAIERLSASPVTQSHDFINGRTILNAVDASRVNMSVDDFKREVSTKTLSAIDSFYDTTYCAIGAGTTATLAGAFLLARSLRQLDAMHKAFVTRKPEPPSP